MLEPNQNSEIENRFLKPMFHLDFHGKYPRNEWKGKIDVGRVPAQVYMKKDLKFIDSLTYKMCDIMDEIYKKEIIGDRQLKPKADPDC